jgi:hypothetical protein
VVWQWSTHGASAAGPATFGKTSVGASVDVFAADRKRVNRYALPVAGSVTKLTVYLSPTTTSGQQLIKGVIYSDTSGKPQALLGESEQLAFHSSNAAGWYDMKFATPVKLAAGNYWIGVITGVTSYVSAFRFDAVANARDYNNNAYASGPTNPFGSVTTNNEQMSLYATYAPKASVPPPTNITPPAISGTAQQGQMLTELHGKWANEPTSFTYQWLQCDSSGNNCQPIFRATNQTYLASAGDVGHTITVQETASNEGGQSSPASSGATATVVSPAPTPVEAPTITGTAQQGQTLTEAHGKWTNEPTSFTYQWLQCDSSGNSCQPIFGATNQTYVVSAGDLEHTIRVHETATNEGGSGGPATSSATAVVVPPAPTNESAPLITGTAQQGKTLTETHGEWKNNPTSFTYQWLRCDSSANNCQPISRATNQTYLQVAADVEHTIKGQEIATNAGGSSGPATSAATAVVIAGSVPPPTNEAPPSITGTAQQGQTLTELHGKWASEPTSFTFQWLQCDSLGSSCLPISGETNQTYVPSAGDVGHTLEVQETASNEGGASSPATSTPTAVVSASSGQHLEYVFVDGLISVYDMDQQQKLVKTINMPQTLGDTRGTTVSPSTHMLFLAYGGDGGQMGTGSVLAYDLVTEKVVWEVHLHTGIDSGAVSPDGKRLYMPTGENDKSGIWNILDTSNGAIIGTIHGGTGAHNTIVSSDGHYVYLGGRDYNYLDVYDTTTGQVRSIGPLAGGVRPFTVNGSNTLAFTTSTRFLGFQASSLTTGKVLFTVSFGSIPSGFPLSAPSHGASLSPDEKQLYVIDDVHKEVHVFDVSRVAEGVAPTELGVVPAPKLNEGKLSPCRYDCVRGGWVQHSLDGRFVYVPTAGEVIETATRKVVATLSPLENTKKSLEVDWANGVPIATSGRTGVGHVG